jgi:Ca2+-binding EF-hand superfamily protein
MTTHSKTLAALALSFLLCAGSITAEESGSGMESAPKWVQKMDTDEDGYISKEEWLADRRADAEKRDKPFNEKKLNKRFSQMDADGDGKISGDEFNAHIAENKKK